MHTAQSLWPTSSHASTLAMEPLRQLPRRPRIMLAKFSVFVIYLLIMTFKFDEFVYHAPLSADENVSRPNESALRLARLHRRPPTRSHESRF